MYRPNIAHPVKFLGYAAIADLFKYLPLSKREPENLEYRQRLQIASWMSLWPIKFPQNSFVIMPEGHLEIYGLTRDL